MKLLFLKCDCARIASLFCCNNLVAHLALLTFFMKFLKIRGVAHPYCRCSLLLILVLFSNSRFDV